MLTALTLTLSLASVSFVAAQSNSNNGALQIEAIEAHFTNAGLVPSLLTTFDPTSILNLTYVSVGAISPGQLLSKDQVADTPNITITPANSSITGLTSSKYTVVMADADIVGTDESAGQTRHWLVNGASLSGDSAPYTLSTDGATAVTEYAGPGPASGSGAHRYVILLLAQGDNFSPPSDLSQANVGVSVFNLTDYLSTSNLGSPIAGTYIQVEEGTATASVSATSAVVTSTLAAAAASASGSGTSSGSASSSTASTSPSNGAQSTALFSAPLFLVAGLLSVMAF